MNNNIYRFLYKYDGILFLFYQISLLIIAFNSVSRVLTITTIIYFYYSVFTGWHECVHREKNYKDELNFNKILGAISISPLIFLSYQQKAKQHLHHHGYTNDPNKDPDYAVNNFLLFRNSKKSRYPSVKKFSSLSFIEIFCKILFIGIILFWFYSGKSLLDFFIGSLIGSLLMHFLVNIFPHYKSIGKYGRDFGGNKFFTLLLLSNNLHGSHHRDPHLPWWSTLFN